MLKRKAKALDLAEVVDAWRIFPRLFLVTCFVWVAWLTWVLMYWYMHLPHEERSLEASGFASVVQVGAMAFLRLVYGTYAEGGRDWAGSQPQVRTEETSRTVQATGIGP